MYSFDVFDTLITRTTATPQGIFALMKDRLTEGRNTNGLQDYVIENFFELRIHSEELIRENAASQMTEEVNLNDIYTAMAVCGCLDKEQMEYLCCMERKTELDHIVGIPENIQRLKELIRQGEHVVLISDMYLSEKDIHEMLVKVDKVFEKIPLYVSSEYGKRKTTGNLYRQVQELENVSYEDWIHIGDNLYQDIEVPYGLGIKVELWKKGELTSLEQEVLNSYPNDSRLQLMIGAALRVKAKKSGDAYYIGSRYAGPVLYSYAEWIVDQSIKKKVKRLYFIARDGYLIKRLVDIILAEKRVPIKTDYIYGSRKAWRMASLSRNNYNLYQLILWSHIDEIESLKELASVIHIPLQELYDYLPGTYTQNKDDDSISSQELEYIARKLSEDNDFKCFHLKKLNHERKLAQEYLFQKLDFQDDDFAFVDVSGSGLTQGCLLELLKDKYSKPIRTFFFRIDRVNLIKGSITDTFMPSFLDNRLIVEMMCRAPHGQTSGYLKEGEEIKPVLEEIETKALIAHGFYEYEKGLLDFCRAVSEVSSREHKNIGSIRNILSYLRYIAQTPSDEILEYFSSMPNNQSGRENKVVEYAPKLTEEDIENIFLKRMNEPLAHFYTGTDLEYSIMRATEREKKLIQKYLKEYHSTLGKLYRQEAEWNQREQYHQYGRAAFFPIRLLEEKIILYGAGKFGQDLYKRLKEDEEHEVVLWVDRKAADYQKKGLNQVHDIAEIRKTADEQIVIAVVNGEVADEIFNELEQMGVKRERMIWIEPYTSPNPHIKWKTEKIG